jgi:lysophospholipase L1-like esterase
MVPTPQPLRRRPTLLRLAAVLVLALVTALGLYEVYLRVADPYAFWAIADRERFAAVAYEPHAPYWRLALKPNVRTTLLGHEVVINSQRMRNRETTVAKPNGTYRILVLGDSVAFGWGVAEADCFPRRIEGRLQRAGFAGGKSIEVINSAVPGWAPHDEILFLEHQGLGYQPDLVLMTLINNDIPQWGDGAPKPLPEPSPARLPSWLNHLYVGKRLQSLVAGWQGVGGGEAFRVDDHPDPLGLQATLEVLRQAKLRCGAVPMVLMDTVGGEPVAAFCKQHGIHYVAAFLPVSNDPRRYSVAPPQDDHPNGAGHAWFAETLVTALLAAFGPG